MWIISMRCHIRRIIHVAFIVILSITLWIIYRFQTYSQHLSSQALEIIRYKNQSYRLLSSQFVYRINEPYLNFAFYHVEKRSRVLRIDPHYDIPVSSQWNSKGHFYPTQIAQFGLSHWSQWQLHVQRRNDATEYFDPLRPEKGDSCSSWYNIRKDPFNLNETFIHFTISSNCSLYIRFDHADFTLIYSTESIMERMNSTFHTISVGNISRSVNRYMLIDIEKTRKKSFFAMKDKLHFRICGDSNAYVRHLTVGDQSLYDDHAYHSAVRWLLDNQDISTGCWWIYVPRFFGDHQQYQVPIPWCSAMAQGQATSLLVRLYLQTKNDKYLKVIRQAVQPLWSSNRTRAYFQNRFVWLEEYPLKQPSHGLFVLNGGLYAMLGLMDAQSIDPHPSLSSFIDELRLSLHVLLPHFIHPNQSNWSLYDLGHLTLGLPVNIASFSYHLVHINLLQSLSSIFRFTHPDTSKFLDGYVQRFRSSLMY